MGHVVRPFKGYPRHPVTGHKFIIRGRTQREVDAALHKVAQVRAELRLDRKLGLPVDVEKANEAMRAIAGKRVTLAQAIDSYASQSRLTPATQKRARSLIADTGHVIRGTVRKGPLVPFAGDRFEALTAPRLARLFRALTEKWSWSHVTTVFHILTATARHAVEEGWIVQCPWGMWRPTKPTHPKRRPLREACRNAAERTALLAACTETMDAQDRAAVACGLFLGCRRGELAGLRQGDLEHGLTEDGAPWVRVRIVRQYAGAKLKRGELRTVDAGAELAEILLALLESRPASVRRLSTPPLFPNTRGEHYPAGDCVNVDHLRAAAARAGLGDPKRWSLHSLRDSFCTIEAQACGGDLRKLMERTGHRYFDNVARYLRTFEREPAKVPALPPSTTQ